MRNDIKWPLDYLRSTIEWANEHERKVLINMCLYYADFLALQGCARHITWCSYFNVSGMPICAPLLADPSVKYTSVEFDKDELTAKQYELVRYLDDAYLEICKVMIDFGWDKAKEFVANICNIIGQPKVSPEHMLYYVCVASDKTDKKRFRNLFEKDKQERIEEYETRFIDPETEEETVWKGNKYTSC